MRPILALLAMLSTTVVLGQQGGLQGNYQQNAVQDVERRIGVYLNGPESKSVLTPGEFNEWPQKLKAGQVLIAEARSDAFDAALQVVDDKGAVLATNDDRYPGDQRPLLLWRCERDGAYALRVRCFKDKSGGQFFVRFRTFETMDLNAGPKVEKEMDGRSPFLFRVPMKAGQIKDIVTYVGGAGNYMPTTFNTVIYPNGLPEHAPSLAEPMSPAILALVAPVAGDYYLMFTPFGRGRGKVRAGTREFAPTKLTKEDGHWVGGAPTKTPVIWELPVKAGELVEASLIGLKPDCKFKVFEAIDFSRFDVTKPETHPFYPPSANTPPPPSPAVDYLPARSRDERIVVFRARRDAKIWLVTDGASEVDKQFLVRAKQAASAFAEDTANHGKLRIANSDYWAFDAKAGDVMTLSSTATGFVQTVIVRDPDLSEIRHTEAALDQTSDDWRMIVEKPGRYLVAMSCMGDGGGGDYTLTRKVFHPTEFSEAEPAKGEITSGQVQVWKFTASPTKPLLIRWTSTAWNYDVAIYDEQGHRADFQRQAVDDHNRFGILKVSKPQTFVIVLVGGPAKSAYNIELGPIPGYKP